MKPDFKDTNPKDSAGSARIDLSLLSPIAMAEWALAMEEGRTKYGAYNFTVSGVKARVYVSAAMRHFCKWLLGEDRDQKTGVHHLGSVMACAAILLDAMSRGKMTDDRPPSLKDASSRLDAFEARVKHVRNVFGDFSPRHYTIKDTQHEQGTGEQTDFRDRQAAAKDRVSREDAQSIPGRHPRQMVFGETTRPLGGVEMAPPDWRGDW